VWPGREALAGSGVPGEELTAMKIALLGTGFGQAHAVDNRAGSGQSR
jgi:hypothetical protein